MTIYSLSGLLTAITSGLMTGLMLFIAKNKLHYLWAVFCFSVFLFGLGIYFVGGAITPEEAALWWRIGHIGAIMIPVLFLHFVHEFLKIKQTAVLVFLYIVSFLLLIADFTGGLFIDNMRFVFGEFYYDSPPGTFYPLFTSIFFGLTVYSHVLLWKGYKESSDKLVKDKIKFFFFGMGVSFAGGAFNFLPVYGIDIYPFMNMTVFFYPLIITYAIIRHQLFDIKLIFVELAILSLNLFLFINIFTSHTKTDYVLNLSIFFAVIAFSTYLIRGIYNEIRDRTRIEELVWERAHANDRLRLMEVQKTEFVSIASHQLRTPLTIIKGYASMLLEGTFGTLGAPAREAMDKLYASSAKLVELVEDLLTVSRIEQGRVVLNFEQVNFKEYVQETLEEIKPEVDSAKIVLAFGSEGNKEFSLFLDKKKFKQVIRHIFENSIKYTPKGGSIHVFIMDDSVGDKVRLIVSDTGSGMTLAQLERFSEEAHMNLAHSPKEDEQSVEDIDMKTASGGARGLGLYIAREIIEAHHGVLYLESAGLGGGVTVVIEIPKNHNATL